MAITILHLSDMHIGSGTDEVLQDPGKIASSIYRYLPDSEMVFVLTSGDIAFSGTKNQYDFAQTFFESLVGLLRKEGGIPVELVLVPGNHDCDFSGDNTVRDMVISQLRAQDEKAPADQVVRTCTAVQSEFFAFRDRMSENLESPAERLWYQYKWVVADKVILFDCLNVSWMSQRHEIQGNIIFPLDQYRATAGQKADLRIAVLHHPLNWLQQRNYQELRAFLRTTFDLIVTGHEHVQGAYDVSDALNDKSTFIEGAALAPHDSAERGGFNVIEVDLDQRLFQCNLFEIADGQYQQRDIVQAWSSYRKLAGKHDSDFAISENFAAFLRDPGANFMHPAKQELELSDIYVIPDLEEVVDDSEEPRLVTADILFNVENIHGRALVKGGEESGKTSLLKRIFRAYHEAGVIPVYLAAEDLSKVSNRDLERKINSAFSEQYSEKAKNRWKNLPKSQKAILIDNIDRCTVSEKYRWRIIDFATKAFGAVILTADELVNIQEITSLEMSSALGGFRHYDIQPFGYKARHELIRKWGSIGDDLTTTSAELLGRVDAVEKIINNVLGKNLIPRVPIYLLTLLQSTESTNSLEIQNSAFGHYYQYLITQSLRGVSVKPGELHEYFNYCSQLAWFAMQAKEKLLSERMLEQFNEKYSKEYTKVEFRPRVDTLTRAKMLCKRGDAYAFCYPYIYYYFLGNYLSANIDDPEVRALIGRCCEHLYVRENANIVLFLAHHSKESFMIDCIVDNLKGLFVDASPINIGDDTAAFNDLVESTSRLIYERVDPEEFRRNMSEYRDEMESRKNGGDLDLDEHEERDKGDLELPARLNMLFKTVEILGQMLRNYYGSLKVVTKRELIHEIYDGPLRALRGFMEVVTENREALLNDVETFLGSKNRRLDANERKRLAQRFVFDFVGLVTFGFLFKAASATALENLKDVVHDVVEENPTISYRLIELASRLDNPVDLPFREIEALAKATEGNIFAHRLLETIVLRHLYLFRVKEVDKQKICEMLGISMAHQRAVDVKTRGTKIDK